MRGVGGGYLTDWEETWQSCTHRTVVPANSRTESLLNNPQQGLLLLLGRCTGTNMHRCWEEKWRTCTARRRKRQKERQRSQGWEEQLGAL